MNIKLPFVTLMLISLASTSVTASSNATSANRYNPNPASVGYVQSYVESQLANIPTPKALDFAEFYALMPNDNGNTINSGSDVAFPRLGPTSGGGITKLTSTSFQLEAIGTYQIQFQMSVTGSAQLGLTLNGTGLSNTVIGQSTGNTQMVGMALVQTTEPNSILTVRSKTNNLVLTTFAGGGTSPVSASLIIAQLK